MKAKANRRNDADHQPADPQPAGHATREEEGTGAAAEPAEARRVHSGLHQHAEETELGLAQGCQGATYQRLRGDRLYPGRGPQSAGALGRDDPRRAREGPAGRALPHRARRARYARREEPQAKTLQIWSKEAEVIRPLCADARANEAARRPREARRGWPGEAPAVTERQRKTDVPPS